MPFFISMITIEKDKIYFYYLYISFHWINIGQNSEINKAEKTNSNM